MKYAEIYNDIIVTIHDELPQAWKNISGFHVLSETQLQDLAWSDNIGYKFYPVTEDPLPSEDRKLYIISELNYTIDEQSKTVVGSRTVTPRSNTEAWAAIRLERNKKLFQTDWTQLTDSPLSSKEKSDFQIYRQVLRDLTTQSDPFNIVWPTEPN